MKDKTIAIITFCLCLAAIPAMIWAHRYDQRKKQIEVQQRQDEWRQDSIEQARYMDSTEKEMKRKINHLVDSLISQIRKP